jgi:hypothetical protein
MKETSLPPSRLSTPEVAAITCGNEECDWAALHLRLYGSSPIAVNFPKLSAMEGNFYIRGDIDSFVPSVLSSLLATIASGPIINPG